MLRHLAALLAVGVMAGVALLMFMPIDAAGAPLRARLGGHEHVGWPGWALRMLYTAVVTAAVYSAVYFASRLAARVRSSGAPAGALSGPLAIVLLYFVLVTPVWAYMGVGVLNMLWDRSPPAAEQYRYVGTVPRSKGPSRIDYARADDPDAALSLYHVVPPPAAAPGDRVTLYRRAGALGMPYMSQMP